MTKFDEAPLVKKTKGRRQIEIKKIEKKSSLQVAFSKRRFGLFKKAEELSILCGVKIAIYVESSAGKVFAFSHGGGDVETPKIQTLGKHGIILEKLKTDFPNLEDFNRHTLSIPSNDFQNLGKNYLVGMEGSFVGEEGSHSANEQAPSAVECWKKSCG